MTCAVTAPEWIPEPLPGRDEWIDGRLGGTPVEPADRVTLDESINLAFLLRRVMSTSRRALGSLPRTGRGSALIRPPSPIAVATRSAGVIDSSTTSAGAHTRVPRQPGIHGRSSSGSAGPGCA